MSNDISRAIETLKKAMRDDPEYAWGWHCNIAMPIADTIRPLMRNPDETHEAANRAAAHLMQHLFGVDMNEDERYEAFGYEAA